MTRTARAAAALLALALPGCVPSGQVTIPFDGARFNEKVRGDFEPLSPADLGADPKFGFFHAEGEAALVTEVYPVSPGVGPERISGRLVQTPCLFIGQVYNGRGDVDELRLGWELIGNIDRDADELLAENFQEGFDEVGLCTMSSPVNRLVFERPGLPLKTGQGIRCGGDDVQFAWTLNRDDPEENANIPSTCVVAHDWPEVVVEAHSPREPDPDAACPGPGTGGHFTGRLETVAAAASVCGYPARGAEPTGDTSYRLSLQQGHSFGTASPERWLSPNVMFVNGGRKVVRALTDAGAGVFRWKTPVLSHGDADKQWAENFMATLRVDRVEILTRDGRGGEWTETPVNNRLTIGIPRPGAGDALVTCTGRVRDGVFSFAIPDDCGFDDSQLRALTPTYAPANLADPRTITRPIEWSASLGALNGRTAFIRFSLLVQGTPRGALRISPTLDFGPMQVHHWRQRALVLRNENGPELEVRAVGFGPGSAHPGDFSFVVAGDPVAVPLPVDSVPGPGGTSWQLSADLSDAPIVRWKDNGSTVDLTLGEPARGSGTEAVGIYGQAAHFVGNLLLRDDPAATLAPAAPAWPRPLAIRAFAERPTPFLLGRNESVKIVVTALPTATGVRTANIHVEAAPIGNPTQRLQVIGQLSVSALDGPQLHGIPESMLFFGGTPHRDDTRFSMIENVGHFDLQVTRIAIVGRNASRFAIASSGRGRPPAPPFTLAPGGHQDIQVFYLPACDGSYTLPYDHEAALRVESNGGTWQLPLYGYSGPFCP